MDSTRFVLQVVMFYQLVNWFSMTRFPGHVDRSVVTMNIRNLWRPVSCQVRQEVFSFIGIVGLARPKKVDKPVPPHSNDFRPIFISDGLSQIGIQEAHMKYRPVIKIYFVVVFLIWIFRILNADSLHNKVLGSGSKPF